jgi:hypothetical protein
MKAKKYPANGKRSLRRRVAPLVAMQAAMSCKAKAVTNMHAGRISKKMNGKA